MEAGREGSTEPPEEEETEDDIPSGTLLFGERETRFVIACRRPCHRKCPIEQIEKPDGEREIKRNKVADADGI